MAIKKRRLFIAAIFLFVFMGVSLSQERVLEAQSTAVDDTVYEIEIIRDYISAITTLPPTDKSIFKNLNHRDALVADLNNTITNLQNGMYDLALEILQMNVLVALDGCALTGDVDGGDKIQSCTTQGVVYPGVDNVISMVTTISETSSFSENNTVMLQPASPGLPQDGHINISGNAIIGGNLDTTGGVGINGLAVIDNTGKWVGDPTGLVGPTGPAGADGIDGATGLQGPMGMQGLPGANGATGSAGADGINGIDGTNGATGATGPQGPAGKDGADGATGPRGPTGPTTPGTNGADGAQGPTGPAGKDGSDGAAGSDGADGATGAQGPTGAAGPQGVTGTDGSDGAAGADGANGATGAQGPTGAAGPQGATGADGSDGAAGADGTDGATGAQGPTGAAGTQGATGADGSDGAAGADGVDGATGAQGPTGAAGTQGATGADGSDGAAGADGADGATGPQGVTGAAGAQGPTGPAGADGADGQDGLSIQGPQGDPGTTSWTDGYGTVSTTGSVQIGNDTAACTSANAGTIRWTGSELQSCDGSSWTAFSAGVTSVNQYSTSLIPKLSANNSASPLIISRSSRHLSGCCNNLEAFKGFNKAWTSWTEGFCLDAPTGWVNVDFGLGRNVTATSYRIRARGDTNFGSNYTYSDWTFEGSNDNTNWTVIDTQTSQIGWGPDEVRSYNVSNAYYRYYRWNVTANEGGEPISCAQEHEIWGYYGTDSDSDSGSGSGPWNGNCGIDQVQDADANWYNTVLIGNQCWMAENLNVGASIDGTTDQTYNSVIEKYCYDYSDANCLALGGLYNWDEMMKYSTSEGVQGICPNGWHLPTDSEWKTLEMELGMTQAQADAVTAWRGTDQGTQLKQGGTSGFEALLVGYRYNYGTFTGYGGNACFWTSTKEGSDDVWTRCMLGGDSSTQPGVYRDYGPKAGTSMPVRCVSD